MGDAVIPNDWDGEYCEFSICWPNSLQWLAVLRNVVAIPSTGRYWNEATGNIKQAQAAIQATFDHNFDSIEVLMSCSNNVGQLIANAIIRLAEAQCCGGNPPSNGGVQFIVNVGGTVLPVYGNEPPASLEPGEVPPGWTEGLLEYRASKCNLAKGIVQGLIYSLRSLSSILFVQSTVTGAAAAAAVVGLIIIQPWLIPVLIAACLILVGANAFVVALADEIQVDFDEWVCALYASDNAEGAITALADLLDIAIARIPDVNPWITALKTLALVLINTDTINQLFTLQGQYGPSDNDCAGCIGGATIEGGTPITITEVSPNITTQKAAAVVTGWGGCGDEQYFVILRKDGDIAWTFVDAGDAIACPDYPGTNKLWTLYTGDLTGLISSENTEPSWPNTEAGSIFILSSVPFTVTVEIEVIP